MSLVTLSLDYILLSVGVYKVGKGFTNTVSKVGGIVVSVLVLSMLGSILSYSGLREIIPEIIIQGEGTVENNITKISVYSNVKRYVESLSSHGKQSLILGLKNYNDNGY